MPPKLAALLLVPLLACVAAVQLAVHSPQISQYVREVFQDRDGNLWFGTNSEGVCRYDGKALVFFNASQGFAGTAIRGILQSDDGAMWFATDAGVSRYRDGVFTNFTTKDGLSDNGTWSIMRDKSGTMWVGTQEGVCKFDGTRFTAFALPRITIDKPESRFTPRVAFAIHQDKAGNIWFGTDGEGAHKYDGKAFTSYTTKEGLCGNMVRCIGSDRKGRVWIGSDGGGVSCIDGTTIKTFTSKDGLSNDRIFEIMEDRAGNLWFSTLGAGACRYDGTTFTPCSKAQGLTLDDFLCHCGSGKIVRDCHPSGGAHVQSFCEDRDGRIWFGCSGGLFRLEGGVVINVTREGPWPKQAAAISK